jgi:AcrR family transcriptional regulator
VALELLAEIGYDRLTIDAVAARAHASKPTIYHRWSGKAELVVDALGCLKGAPPLPDTGSL